MTSEPELPDVVAFIRAHLAGDVEACRSLLATAGGDPGGLTLLSHVVTVAIDVAAEALGGPDRLEAMLSGWQQERLRSMM